jgi:ribosomal protein S15P/S13E
VLALQYLSPTNMSRKQKSKLSKEKVIADFQRFIGDTGSSEVQGKTLRVNTAA